MILFIGDTHGDFKNVNHAISQHNPTAVVFVGDVGAYDKLEKLIISGTEVYWIPGNHEFEDPSDYTNLAESKWGENNISGRVVEINGVKIAGIGGTFNRKIWMPPENPLYETYQDWDDDNQHKEYYETKRLDVAGAIYFDDYLKIMVLQADILVTHEAPSCHPYGFTAIDDLAQSMGVKRLFHGHHHDNLDYTSDENRLGFKPHGIGLCGVTNENGVVVIPGKMDEERREARMAKKVNK